jgi:hypothetical protein
MNVLLRGWTPRERVVALALAVYLVAVVIVLAPVRGAAGGPSAGSLPPAAVPAADEPADRAAPDSGAAPELAASQKLRADQALSTDQALSRALGGVPYTVVKAGPWTTDGAAPRVLGAAYVVAPQKPVALQGAALPTALYDRTQQTDPPYQAVTNKVTASAVSQFLVLVDLEKGQVVSIVPGPGAQGVESTPPAGFKPTVPAPAEEGAQ